MDLSKYIKKNNANMFNIPQKEKQCMQCGKVVEKERAGHLYFQSFCSRDCKEKYVGMELD